MLKGIMLSVGLIYFAELTFHFVWNAVFLSNFIT